PLQLQVTNKGGVPANGVSAVVLNITVTNTASGSFLTAYPAGQPTPVASNLNWSPGETRANLVTVAVGAGGVVVFINAVGATDLIADVEGYYTDSTVAA